MAKIKLKFLSGKRKSPGAFSKAWVVCGLPRSSDDKGNILLSAECINASEIQGNVELLKAELDQVLAQAKKRFKDPN